MNAYFYLAILIVATLFVVPFADLFRRQKVFGWSCIALAAELFVMATAPAMTGDLRTMIVLTGALALICGAATLYVVSRKTQQ